MRYPALISLLLVGCKNDQELIPEDTLGSASAPSLEVTSPDRAAWLSTGSSELTGEVSAVSAVRINGEEHAVTGGSFSAPIELAWGINSFETEALTAGDSLFDRRSVLAGDFAPAEGAIDGAVAARVNQPGLDDASEIVAGMVDAQSINEGIGALNPIMDLDYGLGTGITVDLQSVYFDTPLVSLDAEDGLLAVEVILPDLLVDTDALVSVLWIDSDQDLVMEASYAVINADLSLSLEDGAVAAGLSEVTVSLEGFTYDVSLLPGEIIEDNLFDDTIRTAIEDRLAEEMQTLLPDAIAGLQEGLDLRFETELLGTTISLEAIFADLGIDDDGVWLGMDVLIDSVGTVLDGDGYLAAGVATPEPDRSGDIALMLSDDTLNRAMYELWAGGLLSQRLSTEDGSLDPESLSSFGITDCTIETDAALPPVLVESGGGLQLQLGEVTAALTTPGFSLGERLVLRVAGHVGLDLAYDDGAVSPQLSDVVLSLDIIETDWKQDREDIVDLLQTFITPELLLGSVSDLSLELPALDGLSIDGATIERSGSGFHSDLRLQLSAD